MKILIVILAIAAVAYGQTSPAKALENTLNGLKDQMPCGFPDMDLPPLAPLKISFFDLYHELWILKLYGSIANGAVTGLNNYSVEDVTMNVLTLRAGFSMKFNSINVRGFLNFQSWIISFLKIKPSGNLDMTLKDLRISVKLRFGMVDGKMRLMEFNPTIALGAIEFNSTGFTLLSLSMKVANSMAEKVVMNVFTDYQDAIEQTVQQIVIPTADEFLYDMTISDLLKLLTAEKEPTVCIPPY